MRYNDKINEYYKNLKNIGNLDKKDPDVVRGKSGSASCGDLMTLDIKVDPKTQVILDAKIKIFGCMSAIASSSCLAEMIIGKTIEEAKKITNKEIADKLDLPPIKAHCSVLAEETIIDTIKNYFNKIEYNEKIKNETE